MPNLSGTAGSSAEAADYRRFSEDLVRGVRLSIAELDELLSRCSRNWRIAGRWTW